MTRGEIFKTVSMRKNKRNTFDLSHEKKMTMKMGYLVPTLLQECLPGDTFKGSQHQLIRFAPLVAPIMHTVKIYTHYFFVPNRLVWSNWEDFITGGEDGLQEPVRPYMGIGNGQLTENSTIFDYLGCPQYTDAGTFTVSAIPFAQYNLIYNEYYRDQNLQPTKLQTQLVDGQNNTFRDSLTLMRRAWHHDYFTSALPWTQKGPEVTIPLGEYAYLDYDESGWPDNPNASGTRVIDTATGSPAAAGAISVGATNGIPQTPAGAVGFNVTGETRVDLTGATASSIVDLRNAFRLQEWLEKNARGGSRYTESIYVHFGVHSPDARLQRPEYIGGGVNNISFSEVLQSSGSASDLETGYSNTPQGTMAGHGISAGQNGYFKYFCQEHGYIFGITSIIPETGYQQGIPRHLTREDKFDYFWKQFAHIGEQAIKNKEVFVAGDGLNDETFGYTPRYSEYRYNPSTVHGSFRDNLAFWHLGRIFGSRPVLNSQFIECNPDERIFAVTTDTEGNEVDTVWCHMYNKLYGKRQIPLYGNPMM